MEGERKDLKRRRRRRRRNRLPCVGEVAGRGATRGSGRAGGWGSLG